MTLSKLSIFLNRIRGNTGNKAKFSRELCNNFNGLETVDNLLWLLDNNYIDKFEKELNENGGEEFLTELLKLQPTTSEELYFYSRVVSLNLFYKLLYKLSKDNKKKVGADSIKLLEKMFNKKNFDNIDFLNPLYFSAVNTTISYFSYNIPLIESFPNYLKNNIVFIFDFWYNFFRKNVEKFVNLTDAQKLVFISNLKLLNNWLGLNYEYSFFFKKINLYNLEKFDYFSFLVDYAGFDIDLSIGQIKGDLKVIPNWLNTLNSKTNIADFSEKLEYLSNYTSFLNIKLISNKYFKLLDHKNTHLKVTYYFNQMSDYLSNQIGDIPLQFLKSYIKSLIIRFFNLSFQSSDLKIKFHFEPCNGVDLLLLQDEDLYSNELFSLDISKNECYFSLKVTTCNLLSLDSLSCKDIYIDNFKRILEKLFQKLINLNYFHLHIDTKLSKLRLAHEETLFHMDNIGELMFLLTDDFPPKEKIILNQLLNKFLVINKKDLLRLVGYLHDIGKADNFVYMEQYSSINVKIFSILKFILIFKNIFNIKNIKDKEKLYQKEELDIVNFSNLINKFLNQYGKKIDELANKFSKDFSDPQWIFNSINRNVIDKRFIESINEIYNLLSSEKLNIQILAPNLDKDILIHSLKLYFEKIDLLNYFDKDSFFEKFNFNYFLFSIFLFLDGLTKVYISKLTIPHIENGIDFFTTNPEFNYLSWVLLHHNYPSFGKFKEKKLDKGLIKWAELTDNTELKKIIPKLNPESPFPNEYKDFFMVLLTAVDLIDALFSKRGYQKNTIVCAELFNIYRNMFSVSFQKYIENILLLESLYSTDNIWEKIIGILDKQFENNPNWLQIRNLLFKNKSKILQLYKA